MRDLLFKNLTSEDRKRKILVSSEIADDQGIHSVIRRHFICQVREIQEKDKAGLALKPHVFVLKERNNKEKREKFFCKIKGSLYVLCNNRLYLLFFVHSLKIVLTPQSQHSLRYR